MSLLLGLGFWFGQAVGAEPWFDEVFEKELVRLLDFLEQID